MKLDNAGAKHYCEKYSLLGEGGGGHKGQKDLKCAILKRVTIYFPNILKSNFVLKEKYLPNIHKLSVC